MFTEDSWHPPVSSHVIFRDENGSRRDGYVTSEEFTPSFGWKLNVRVTATQTISKVTQDFEVYTKQIVYVHNQK